MAAHPERSGRGDDVAAVVRAVLERARQAAGGGVELVGSGVDDAVRLLVDRRVQRALRSTAPPPSPDDVVLALSGDGTSSGARRVGQAGVWLASRGRMARTIGGRTPAGLVVAFGPQLYDAVARNVRGLDAAIELLVGRARARGVEPDPARLRAVVVQALTGAPVDPDADPDHGGLVRSWLADAGRRVAPFGLGNVRGLTRGRTAEAVVAALGSIDVRGLRGH